jgi:hypothetical protein
MKIKNLLVLAFFALACSDHIIERAASDYFPYSEGNWWIYSDGALYEPQTVRLEVEAVDTILQVECYSLNFSGEFHYISKTGLALNEYIQLSQNYGGQDYLIAEGFVKRIELPLVKGNIYSDSLVDSLDFFGEWIKGRYLVRGVVSDHQNDPVYGEIYKVIITTTRTITTPDTTITNEELKYEYYAPGIGLVRFDEQNTEFRLVEYNVE